MVGVMVGGGGREQGAGSREQAVELQGYRVTGYKLQGYKVARLQGGNGRLR